MKRSLILSTLAAATLSLGLVGTAAADSIGGGLGSNGTSTTTSSSTVTAQDSIGGGTATSTNNSTSVLTLIEQWLAANGIDLNIGG